MTRSLCEQRQVIYDPLLKQESIQWAPISQLMLFYVVRIHLTGLITPTDTKEERKSQFSSLDHGQQTQA